MTKDYKDEIEEILNNDDIEFNDKNQAEELFAFTKQNMGI